MVLCAQNMPSMLWVAAIFAMQAPVRHQRCLVSRKAESSNSSRPLRLNASKLVHELGLRLSGKKG